MSYYTAETLEAGPYRIRAQSRKGKITHLWLPFDPDQWIGLLSKEGPWLGVCCGAISRARDLFFGAVREDGQISAEDFRDLMTTLTEHDGFEALRVGSIEAWQEEAVAWIKRDARTPHVLLGWLWFAVRHRLAERAPELDPVRFDKPLAALAMLAEQASCLSWSMLVFDEPSTRPCRKAEITLALAKMLPAARTIQERIGELAPEPFDGYAVVFKDSGEVVGISHTPMIYATMEELRRAAVMSDFARGRLVVRRCRVSFPEGLVLGEEVSIGHVEPLRAEAEAAVVYARERVTKTRDGVRLLTEALARDETLLQQAEADLATYPAGDGSA